MVGILVCCCWNWNVWFRVEGSGCFVRHDEVRDFYDVDCMEEVQYLVEALAGNHECLPRETEMECSGFERCYWYNLSWPSNLRSLP